MWGQQVVSMVGGTGFSTYSTPGHSNRIFSLKFHPLDSSIIVSGKPEGRRMVYAGTATPTTPKPLVLHDHASTFADSSCLMF